jgi:hypothetical protein
MAHARITCPPPPTVPPFPTWARLRGVPKTPEDAGFLAGAALAALHPIACHDHPIGALWRQRLALANAAVLARHAGRTEDEAALRDAWYLRRPGDDPGPRGACCKPGGGSPSTIRWTRRFACCCARKTGWPISQTPSTCLSMRRSRTSATPPGSWPQGRGVRSRRPRRSACKSAVTPRRSRWLADAELARRGHQLLTAAPKLRGRDAAHRIEMLLTEDAQAATAGASATDRSSRRLFDRLVAIGAARELTGRPTFRLYGL